jgi:hypothetical protein
MLVRKNTALGGRKNRGRVYVPAGVLPEVGSNQAGFIDVADVAAWQGRWDDWFDAIVAADYNPYLYHQYDPDLGELPEVPTAITAFAVQPQIATQRLRMR